MSKHIDFYFDFISPYSYLAHKKIINLNQRNIFNFYNIFISDKGVGAYKIKIKIYMITHTDLFFLRKKF